MGSADSTGKSIEEAMPFNPQQPENSDDSAQPSMVTDSSGVYVSQNEEKIYEEEDCA